MEPGKAHHRLLRGPIARRQTTLTKQRIPVVWLEHCNHIG
jgi:hypothetical protein